MKYPKVPDNKCVYAIGDIHGRCDLLSKINDLIAKDIEQKNYRNMDVIIVYLGDYIDRGSSSKEVIETLISFNNDITTVFLAGNHEKALLDFLEHPENSEMWLTYGGCDTLKSYGVANLPDPNDKSHAKLASLEFKSLLPNSHLQFFKSLQNCYICGDYYFVHAGINPESSLSQQLVQDLLWIREPFLSSEVEFEKFIIHGHTITTEPELKNNRINIDTGAYKTDCLTCIALRGTQKYFLST